MLSSRAVRLLFAAVAILLPAALWSAQWLHSPSVMARATRRKIEATRSRWESWASSSPDRTGTYAGVVLEDGSAGAWSELLVAAGVPQPVRLPPGAQIGREPMRLLVVSDEPPGSAAALTRPGRAVVGVPVAVGPLRGTVARWNGLALPLRGVQGRALVPTGSDTPMLVSNAGEVLALRREQGGGVFLQLGIDLAAALFRARQGDPTAALIDRDGNGRFQAIEQVELVPAELAERPWADELVESLLAQLDRSLLCPLPRTNGLPDSRPVVVITADQDVDDGDLLLHMSNRLQARNAGATFLLAHPGLGAPPTARALPADTITELLANGHGVGVHPQIVGEPDLSSITAAIGGLAHLAPLVSRNHLRLWAGALAVPRAQDRAHVVMDLDLAPQCVERQPCAAFVGGSTRPMRFLDAEGRLLPVLQQPTAVDDSSLRDPDLAVVRATAAALGARAEELLARATLVQGPLVVDAHPALFAVGGEWLTRFTGTGINVMSAEAWLDFVTRRRQSRIGSPTCNAPPSAQLQPGITLRTVRP